jgi:Tol biopolymer transport system component
MAAAAVVLAGVVAALAVAAYRREPPAELRVALPGVAAPFALSPDGNRVAYSAQGRLWLRSLDAEDATPLAGTEGVRGGTAFPFWSPDGASIGFFADNQLKRVDLDTGLVQSLANAPNPIGGTWGEGVMVFAPTASSPLMRVGEAGGDPAPVTSLERAGHKGHRFPSFLSDGRRFVFFALGPRDRRGVYLGSLQSGDTYRLMEGDSAAVSLSPDILMFSRAGALFAQRFDADRHVMVGETVPVASRVLLNPGVFNAVAMSASTSGVLAYMSVGAERQLMWVDRAGRVLEVVGTPDARPMVAGALSPDSRTLAVRSVVDGNTDIWLIDLSRGIHRRLTSDPYRDSEPVWSPDGSQMLFVSERSGVYDMYVTNTDGTGGQKLVLASEHAKTSLDWSADGRFLLYAVQNALAERDLWALPVTGDQMPIAVAATPFEEGEGRFSPDGKWVAYTADDTGRREVYVQRFPTGARVQVSTDGGQAPQWRGDSGEIFYVDAMGRAVAVRVDVGGPQVRSETPEPLFKLTNIAVFAAAPDGQRFLVTRDTRFAPPVTLLLNWRGLRR